MKYTCRFYQSCWMLRRDTWRDLLELPGYRRLARGCSEVQSLEMWVQRGDLERHLIAALGLWVSWPSLPKSSRHGLFHQSLCCHLQGPLPLTFLECTACISDYAQSAPPTLFHVFEECLCAGVCSWAEDMVGPLLPPLPSSLETCSLTKPRLLF